MAGLDRTRVALVVAGPVGGSMVQGSGEDVATGYFLTGDLVLTARHVADRPDRIFQVRADVDGAEEDRWSDAVPVWIGVGDVDALLLRTKKRFGDWTAPTLRPLTSGRWESAGYAKIADDTKRSNRKTLPLDGSFDVSLGQGAPELALRTNQIIASKWDDYWKGVSGAPIFCKDSDCLIGVITDANRAMGNSLVGLPAARLLEDIRFRSTVTPSFIGELPDRPWCLVLTSEGQASDLVAQVAGVLAGFRDEDPQFAELQENPIRVSLLEALASVESWAAAVAALAQADCLIADVTSFEPAMMLLLGVRSVLRRGVTISVTRGRLSTHASTVPFNVQETRVLSYGDDTFYDDLHRAMSEGVANLGKDSNYLDLPAYHAVRAPRPQTWADDDAGNVLVLCPFGPEYSEFYRQKLRSIIRGNTRNKTPLRMLDLRSPRLVGQALYEQIRWSSRCIVDWTGWRPNVFFELGVRLACSDQDPLCLIEDPEGAETRSQPLRQHRLLRELLQPVAYDRTHPHDQLKPALERWSRPQQLRNDGTLSEKALPSGGTFAVAQASFSWQQEAMLIRPDIEQRDGAERILGKDQERLPERLVLFAGNEQFDAELRAAVRERWIAAWLYLRHLNTSDATYPEDVRTELLVVSQLVQHALTSSQDPRHARLRREIRDLLRAERGRKRPPETGDGDG
jgi:hypothetical protein